MDLTDSRNSTDSSSGKTELLARAGYVAKGVVYATIGALLLVSIFGNSGGGEVTGSRGAIRTIAQQPFGSALLILMIGGLAGYVLWRLTQAVKDTEDKGSDAAGWMQRIGFGISGLFYTSLAYYAVTLTGWVSGGSSSGSTKQELTAKLMSNEAGIWAVGLVGAAFIAIGVYQFYRSVTCKFLDSWKTHELSASQQKFATRFAQAGIGARAVTFLMIGGLVVKSAFQADPDQAQGLGHALQALGEESYGAIMLTLIGIGLLCYGVYCFVNAGYKRMSI